MSKSSAPARIQRLRPWPRHYQLAWQRIIPYFRPSYRIILYYLVFAGSVNPDLFDFRKYTSLEAYVDDLLAILDALHVDHCAYVGHSLSPMIGILASIRRLKLFTKLIFIDVSPRFLNDEDYHGGYKQNEIKRVFTTVEANYEAWVNGFAPLAVGADFPDFVREFSQTLVYYSDRQGRVHARVRGGRSEEALGWPEYGGKFELQGALAAFECTGVISPHTLASSVTVT